MKKFFACLFLLNTFFCFAKPKLPSFVDPMECDGMALILSGSFEDYVENLKNWAEYYSIEYLVEDEKISFKDVWFYYDKQKFWFDGQLYYDDDLLKIEATNLRITNKKRALIADVGEYRDFHSGINFFLYIPVEEGKIRMKKNRKSFVWPPEILKG